MSKPTLLLVDDEERILRSLRMLFFTGYNVRMTTDANEAIRILKEERIHVIVSDQRMPIMLGAELLRIAREISPCTMRILLTGYSDLDASIACVNEGEVFRYLLKPWSGEEVKQVVADAAAIALATFANERSPYTAAMLQQKARILVLDSDESTVHAVREVLRDSAEVIWAGNLQHATEVLSQVDIAVLVADVMLDGKNISYMLKTVKQQYPKTQSMVVTSFKDTSHLIDLINQAQIARYLPKPLRKNILGRNLEYLIERFRAVCTVPLLQTRHSVAPISDPKEQAQAHGLMDLLNRLRLHRATA
ncbi:MAG: response regulator [Sideroxydans sp.]|nr:response regulator [Sideroxydans sp.]